METYNAATAQTLANLQTQIQQLQSGLMRNSFNNSIEQINKSPIQTPPMTIPSVNGLDGAKEFLKKMPANSQAAVFDKNSNSFYALAVDANGVPAPIKICPFTIEDIPEPESNTVTKEDFAAFKTEIRDLMNSLAEKVSDKSRPVKDKPNAKKEETV